MAVTKITGTNIQVGLVTNAIMQELDGALVLYVLEYSIEASYRCHHDTVDTAQQSSGKDVSTH